MLKNFNKPLNQKSQTPMQHQPATNQKQAVVAQGVKPVPSKGISKHEQIELLALLDKCTQIMKDDRLNMRNLIKDGIGQEVEEILLKYKKKQDIQNLTLDLRKYINKAKFKGGQTPSSNASNLAPTPNQRGSQSNLQQQMDVRQTRKGEQEQVFRQQQQKTFTDAVNVQQNKNMVHIDENQQYAIEQQRQHQHQLAMQMRQQQQLLQQQQLEQQMKQQSQYPQKMSPFRRPQHQQMQEMNNSNSPLKQSDQKQLYQDEIKTGGAFGNFLEQQKSYSNASQARTEQKITEYTEEDEQNIMQMQQQSLQNQQVEVNENEESTLRKRLQDAHEEEGIVENEGYDHQDMGEEEQEQEEEEEYLREDADHSQYRSQSQYSHTHMSDLKQQQQQQQQFQSQQSQNGMVSDSAMITQNSQDLTPEQQYQYLQNLENQGQQYFQQQFSSQIRRSSMEENEEQAMSQQQVEEAIFFEQQRIQQQEEEMARVKREREQFIQQAIERSEQSRFGNSNVVEDNEQEALNQQRGTARDEDDSQVQEEFFDQITDLEQKDPNLNKLGLIKLGSLQRGNSYQIADDPVTPMNHPVHMDNEVQRAPVKHRMEEISEQEDDDPFNQQKRFTGSASNTKSQFSEVKYNDINGEQRYELNQQESRKKQNTQESESKFNQSVYSLNNQNSVRKSNNEVEMTTEFIQHNFEAQMERAYFEQQHQKSAQRSNNLFEDKSMYSTQGQQMSAEKQQFNHMNLFNCAVSGFAQDSVQQPYSAKGVQEYDSKVSYGVDNYVRSATNQFTQPSEEIDDSCSINFANEKVELKYNVEEMNESSVRDSNIQIQPQLSYVPKSEILKAFSEEQAPQTTYSYNMPSVNVNYSTTLNVVQKTYDNYYPERVAIDISGNLNLFQKKTTPTAPVNIFSTPSQSKYLSVGISQEQANSNGKVYSSSILPPSILRSPAFRREYLRGTADPSANRDRVTSVISPSRDHLRMDPSRDPIKRKYNHLFTSPQLMKQCNVEFEKENIGISHSPDSQQQFISSERELIEQETKDFLRRSVDKSGMRFQTGNSHVLSNWDHQELPSSRLRDSSVPKKSINFIRSPYSSSTLRDSIMSTPNMKQSIQLPMFMANANNCANSDKTAFIAKFSLYSKTAQEVFDYIFGDLIFQDKVTKLAFRSRMTSQFPNVSSNEIDNFFDFLDINQDQVLDVNEVGPVLMNMCDYKSKENGRLIKVFNFLDIDRKGFVTRFETEHLIQPSILKKNYHNTGHNLSKQMFKEIDIENKGYITYWELYSCKNSEPVKQLVDILTR